LVKVDLSVVGKGYRAKDLIGKDVVNAKDEEIGTIEDIIIDQQRNLYAVLEVGSFLGLGGHLVVVPYETFKIDATGDKVELAEASKEELQKLEEFKYEEK
jgi:sporulation protein YlmC with PRC-barrel domain